MFFSVVKKILKQNFMEIPLRKDVEIEEKLYKEIRKNIHQPYLERIVEHEVLPICFEKKSDNKYHLLGITIDVKELLKKGAISHYVIKYAELPEPYKTLTYEIVMKMGLSREIILKD